ncbi:MAG: molybdate ABC transporter permease subunit [Actinomycetota bacterium]|nr:molybdate ABC transporter permease subunit [Actinomycetota bacterium]
MKRARLPGIVFVAAAAGVAFVVLPLVALVIRAPWSNALHELSKSSVRTALIVSLEVSLGATALAFALGMPIALALSRSAFPGRAIVRGVVLLPLVLPPVVAGVALLSGLGRSGIIGDALHALGVSLPFTAGGAAVAAAFVSLPLLVLALEAGLSGVDTRLEDAALSLGASPWFALSRVTLPLMRPHIAAALVIAWARALGEFGATITFAGNLRGRTQTLPLAVFEVLQTDPAAATILSLLLVAVSLIALFSLRGRFLVQR